MAYLEWRARFFAEECHRGQTRKYTGEPYINHPHAVADLVRSVEHTPEMIAAAILHDVVEDTEATLDEIEIRFGKRVMQLVEMLTDVSKPSDGNRAKRKAIDREHTAKADAQGQTIKLADLINNTKSITENDPEFAKIYLVEKGLLLSVLGEGDPKLFKIAHDILWRGKEEG